MATFTSALRPRLIYVFGIADEAHADCLKIGETTLPDDIGSASTEPNSDTLNRAARARIKEYTRTAGVSYELLHTELALCIKDGGEYSFRDKEVHSVLERSGIKRKEFPGATEWFCCDLKTAINAIQAVKAGRTSLRLKEITEGQTPYLLRPEQHEAVERTLKRFKQGDKMLWNAKMRFGKTVCALRVAKKMGCNRTIIITHRPVVDKSWFDDFNNTFCCELSPWVYGSRKKGAKLRSLLEHADKGTRCIYFASVQDLRGSKGVGGKHDKNGNVFSTSWDLVIIDEAHEGMQTELGEAVLRKLVQPKTKVLSLSGTPFNLLDQYTEEEVFTWDYVMEQRAKAAWNEEHPNQTNPYACLPKLSIYTYDLGSLQGKYSDEDKAFNFREFFRTREGEVFVYEADVIRFLDLLCHDDNSSSFWPFSERHRDLFRHSLWVLPGVKEAKALSKLLDNHPVFGEFDVVNVAGRGDEEIGRREALKLVTDTIGDDSDATRTITLSCGRLTTGVSVKPWTGVFMMAGSTTTSAATYMQTIFRVQTPYTHNGKMKTDCYAFDFAPDRMLRIFAETAKVSHKVGKQTDEDRKILGEFLNFCPIISISGSSMEPYDVEAMLGQLKRAQIERVVQGGFEDGALYNDELLELSAVKLEEFEELKKVIGETKKTHQLSGIDINRQGFSDEEYAEKAKLKATKKEELSPDEQKRLDELKKKSDDLRRNAISILRSISIRMPLMLYGAEIKKDEDKELSIDNFVKLVDEQSWKEFMPRGVTKEVFQRFKRYYDPDVFREAGKRIREIARKADDLTIEDRIGRITALFATFRNPDKETVLTPWRVVNMHLADSLGGYCFMDKAFAQPLDTPRQVVIKGVTDKVFHPKSRILEINSKSGLYPLYAAYSIYRTRLREESEKSGEVDRAFALELWDQTLEENIWVVCKTPMARSITRRTLAGFRGTVVHAECYPYSELIAAIKAQDKNTYNRAVDEAANMLRSGEQFWKIKINGDEAMKIDAIIGNPPYQIEGENTRKTPIYHLFYDLSSRLSEKVTLITPGRFLFRAGQTPKWWIDKVLSDNHFKVIRYLHSSTDVFPTVDIKGGIAITYRDATQDFGAIGFFKAYKELGSLSAKVEGHGTFSEGAFAMLVSSRGMYRFTETLFEEYPEAKRLQAKGTGNMIASNAFEVLPNVFVTDPLAHEDYIQMYGRCNDQRVYRWIKKKYVMPNDYLEKYNVFVPEANGSGAIGEVLSTPLIGEPLIGVTDTFISIGAFDTRFEAEACLKYVKTRFARTMLGIRKATQHNPKDTWRLVPLQDFTSSSDIDWSRSVDEIDAQLYRKYGLDPSEIAFIEEKVRPME